MKIQEPKGVAKNKVLFIWDGSSRWFAQADQLIADLGSVAVYAAHAMPHESIYDYGSISNERIRCNLHEMELRSKFQKMAKQFTSFRNVNLTLLFGDSVNEIAQFATQFKMNTVLMPRFDQSSFSTWIHGDLNKKFASKFSGDVTMLCEQTAEKANR